MDATKTLLHDWLAANRGRWRKISEETGVNYWWIHKFMGRGIKKPGFEQTSALLAYRDKELRRSRRKHHTEPSPRSPQL